MAAAGGLSVSLSAGAEQLATFTQAASAAGRIALDTEFMGEGRYRTLLCLVQLAVPEEPEAGERIMLVDPLQENVDWSPLARVLEDPAVQVVVHAGRQDIALLRRRLGCEVRNVFDTQVAAGFAGLGAQSSYEHLLSEMLGLRVAKTASFTRWDARPLSPEQLAYAREDVVHLLELAEELERRLESKGRLQWAHEECEPLARSSDERDPQTILERLPRSNGLAAHARPVARELVEWRERTAARHDRPVQSVLGDAPLMEIARRRPKTRQDLERIRGVGAQGRRADELIEAVRRGAQRPPETAPERSRGPASRPDDAALVALSEALLRARAREAGLAYELLAARADLQAIVAGEREGRPADVRTLRGWRRELVGAELLALLAGERTLAVEVNGGTRRLRIEPPGGSSAG